MGRPVNPLGTSASSSSDEGAPDRLEEKNLERRLVILDTSFLLGCIQSGRDFFSQLERELGNVEYIVPKSVIGELNSLAKKGGKKGKGAKLALDVIERKGVKVIEAKRPEADQDILKLASKFKGLVVTLDWGLVVKLRKVGVPVAYIKDGKMELEDLGVP